MDRLRDGLFARLRENPKAEMPFLDHLEELRWRILWSILALVIGTVAGAAMIYFLNLFELIVAPARHEDVLGEDFRPLLLSPLAVIYVYLQVAVTIGFVLASPVIFYQIWVFLAPALEKHERRAIVPTLWMGLVLFAAGVALAYYVALPLTLRFVIGVEADYLEPGWTANYYLRFVIQLHTAFGVIFELPVVILILSALGLVSPSFLRSKRKHSIVGILIVACLLSPGDAIQVTAVMMVPMIVLYEFSIALSALVWRRRRRREREREEVSAAPEDSVAEQETSAAMPEPTPYDHGDPAGGSAPPTPEGDE